MPTKILRQIDDIDCMVDILRDVKLPVTVSWETGDSRKNAQNRLSQRWYTDIYTQRGDQTREEIRAMCKVQFGVPILRSENDAFKLSYDKIMKNLPYEDKIAAIMAFDLPVTRMMTVKQMSIFMDIMSQYWGKQGVMLTDPETLRYELEIQHRYGAQQKKDDVYSPWSVTKSNNPSLII